MYIYTYIYKQNAAYVMQQLDMLMTFLFLGKFFKFKKILNYFYTKLKSDKP